MPFNCVSFNFRIHIRFVCTVILWEWTFIETARIQRISKIDDNDRLFTSCFIVGYNASFYFYKKA